MTKHRFGNFDKLREETILEGMAQNAIRSLLTHKTEEVKQCAHRCIAAFRPTEIDDPGRLPTVRLQDDPPDSWVRPYHYAKESKALVLEWWAYKKGNSSALEVIVRCNVIEWMLDNDYKLWCEKGTVPCESQTS